MKNNFDINEIQFRPMEDEDIEEIIQIARSAVMDRLKNYSDSVGTDIVAYDFADAFENSDYSEVAVLNGKPVAVLLGRNDIEKNKSKEKLPKILKNASGTLNLILQKDGWKMYRHALGYQNFDKALLEEANRKFDGELVYFNQLPELYDSEVGYQLLEHFRKSLQEEGAYNFYLIVHSDKKGQYFKNKLFRLDRQLIVPREDQEDLTISLYEYIVSNPVE